MDGVTRIGVSLEPELLKDFDKVISKKGYVSRSEAIRDLVRDSLAENEWKNDKDFMSGVIVMIYDHHTTGIGEKLTKCSTAGCRTSTHPFTCISTTTGAWRS